MKEKVIDINRALFLKEKGFKKKTYFYYQLVDLFYSTKGLKKLNKLQNHNEYSFVASAPTFKQYEKFMTKNKLSYEEVLII